MNKIISKNKIKTNLDDKVPLSNCQFVELCPIHCQKGSLPFDGLLKHFLSNSALQFEGSSNSSLPNDGLPKVVSVR